MNLACLNDANLVDFLDFSATISQAQVVSSQGDLLYFVVFYFEQYYAVYVALKCILWHKSGLCCFGMHFVALKIDLVALEHVLLHQSIYCCFIMHFIALECILLL